MQVHMRCTEMPHYNRLFRDLEHNNFGAVGAAALAPVLRGLTGLQQL